MCYDTDPYWSSESAACHSHRTGQIWFNVRRGESGLILAHLAGIHLMANLILFPIASHTFYLCAALVFTPTGLRHHEGCTCGCSRAKYAPNRQQPPKWLHQWVTQGLKLTLIPRSDFLLLLSKSWSKSDRHRSYFLSLKADTWLDWVAKLCS